MTVPRRGSAPALPAERPGAHGGGTITRARLIAPSDACRKTFRCPFCGPRRSTRECAPEVPERFVVEHVDAGRRDFAERDLGGGPAPVAERRDDGVVAEVAAAARHDDDIARAELAERRGVRER